MKSSDQYIPQRLNKCNLVILNLMAFCLLITMVSCRPAPPDYTGSRYLIISPTALMDSVSDLVTLKTSQGFMVETVTLEAILTSSSGLDDPEKIRNYLIDYSEQDTNKAFVLLVGSIETMPMRIAYTDPADHYTYNVPTDYYYQELTCDWDLDGDGFYGEWDDDLTKDNCDYKVEVYVGRLPWDSPLDVAKMVETIISYENDYSARMKTAIGAAATIVNPCDAATFVNLAKNSYAAISGYHNVSLYEECPSLNPDFELSRNAFLEQWEALEPGFVAWFSHGNSFGSYYNSYPYTFIDKENIPQNVKPAIAFTSGCTVGNPEVESLGRILVREGIAAAFVGASRETSGGDDLLPGFMAQFQMGENFILRRQAVAVAIANALEYYIDHEVPIDNIPGMAFNQNIFEFMIYGDPAIQVR